MYTCYTHINVLLIKCDYMYTYNMNAFHIHIIVHVILFKCMYLCVNKYWYIYIIYTLIHVYLHV